MVLLTGCMKVSWTILISRGQNDVFVYKTSKKSLFVTDIHCLSGSLLHFFSRPSCCLIVRAHMLPGYDSYFYVNYTHALW